MPSRLRPTRRPTRLEFLRGDASVSERGRLTECLYTTLEFLRGDASVSERGRLGLREGTPKIFFDKPPKNSSHQVHPAAGAGVEAAYGGAAAASGLQLRKLPSRPRRQQHHKLLMELLWRDADGAFVTCIDLLMLSVGFRIATVGNQ